METFRFLMFTASFMVGYVNRVSSGDWGFQAGYSLEGQGWFHNLAQVNILYRTTFE